MASDEFLKERRLRRLRSMFGPGSVVLPQEDVNGQAGRSDGMVKAWLTHPDGVSAIDADSEAAGQAV